MELSAAIPCFNHAATLRRCLSAVRAQLGASAALLVIDDGSADGSATVAAQCGAAVIAHGANLGRGTARARALAETSAALLLMCDATLELPPGFLARALPWFEEPRVAAVFGYVTQPPPATTAERWRGRHLFKTLPPAAADRSALLATGACVLRVEAVRAAGGFDPALRHGEDADLGRRLLAGGWQVVADPALPATCLRTDSIIEALARYARWNAPSRLSWRNYARQISYSIKVMAREDLRERDPASAALSLLSPHYQFWSPILRRQRDAP